MTVLCRLLNLMSMLSFLYRQIRSEVRVLFIIEPRTPLDDVSQAGTIYIIKIASAVFLFCTQK